MPTIKKEIKPKVEILDLKDGKKQYYKSGPHKGEVKKKMKSPAKYQKDLDIKTIQKLFDEADIVVLENQNPMRGNTAASSATLMKNFGKLLALAELSGALKVIVQPQVWKKHYGLTMSKSKKATLTSSEYKKMSIKKTYELTEWNTSYDGIADAICLGSYVIECGEINDNI